MGEIKKNTKNIKHAVTLLHTWSHGLLLLLAGIYYYSDSSSLRTHLVYRGFSIG